jgi:hypothetical protein
LKRDAGLTGAAFPPQYEIADDRDIVVPWDLVVTVWAMGRREDNRLVFWQATDAYIQKRTDHGAEDEGEYVKENRKNQLCTNRFKFNSHKPSKQLE